MTSDKQSEPTTFLAGKAAWAWDSLSEKPVLVTVLGALGDGRYEVLPFGRARPTTAKPLHLTVEDALLCHSNETEAKR